MISTRVKPFEEFWFFISNLCFWLFWDDKTLPEAAAGEKAIAIGFQ
jgi:hypothetical protein